jgi:hypothetical protein
VLLWVNIVALCALTVGIGALTGVGCRQAPAGRVRAGGSPGLKRRAGAAPTAAWGAIPFVALSVIVVWTLARIL